MGCGTSVGTETQGQKVKTGVAGQQKTDGTVPYRTVLYRTVLYCILSGFKVW